MNRRLMTFVLSIMLILTLGCSGGGEELVIYSGRSKPLVDGLVKKFKKKQDMKVSVKYGKDAQLLAALKEEGTASPADVYWANTTGALSNAVNNDLLSKLPKDVLSRADRFVPSNKRWVPITTRFRVLAYNSDKIDPKELPDSVLDLPKMEQLEGRIGWTPTYSSFQDFLTMLRIKRGEKTTRNWIRNMSELNPKSYTSNTPMIRALAAGEIDVALTNHYYILRLKHGGAEGEYEGHEEHEEGGQHEEEESPKPSAPVKTYHFEKGDPGNLALVTGAGVISSTDQSKASLNFLRFLLSEEAQAFAATQVNEYPVVSGTDVPDYMMPVEQALSLSPDFNHGKLGQLEPTLELLRDQGIL